jgi:hypothetical protein
VGRGYVVGGIVRSGRVAGDGDRRQRVAHTVYVSAEGAVEIALGPADLVRLCDAATAPIARARMGRRRATAACRRSDLARLVLQSPRSTSFFAGDALAGIAVAGR